MATSLRKCPQCGQLMDAGRKLCDTCEFRSQKTIQLPPPDRTIVTPQPRRGKGGAVKQASYGSLILTAVVFFGLVMTNPGREQYGQWFKSEVLARAVQEHNVSEERKADAALGAMTIALFLDSYTTANNQIVATYYVTEVPDAGLRWRSVGFCGTFVLLETERFQVQPAPMVQPGQ